MKVVIDMFNGEGYSEPTVTVATTKEEERRAVKEAMKSYPSEYHIILESEPAHIMTFEGDEDCGTIYSLPLSEGYNILHLNTDELSSNIHSVHASREDAVSTLRDIINSVANDYAEDDIEDWDESEDIFSSHGDYGFEYYQIVKG